MDAVQRAADIVRKQLQAGAWIPGERMPSLALLSHTCAVSRTTMWHALNLLKRESLVHAHRGGAIIAGSVGAARPEVQGRGYAWEQLRDRIGQEIVTGAFRSNENLPVRTMARRYGVAIGTLKKALNALVAAGVLTREGRWFRRVFGPSRRFSASVVLISSGDPEKGVVITDPRTGQVIDSFERACSRLGFQSRCEGFSGRDPRSLIRVMHRIRNLGEVDGFIVNLWMDWNETYWSRWLDLLAALADRNVPVVVLDQDGGLVFPKALLGQPLVRVLRIAGRRAGEMVGQLLLREGHRRIAYLMPGSQAPWAQNRYAGLSRCYQQLGGAGSKVEFFSRDEVNDTYDLTLAVLGLDEKQLRAIYRKRLSDKDIRNLTARLYQKRWRRLKKTLPQAPAYRSIRRVARFMTEFSRDDHELWLYDYLLDALVHIASNSAGEQYLTPFFATVARASRASAWVCTDDKTALWALSYLRNHGKRVPEDIAVIGFENWREAHEQQLSTYDFNMDGMVQQALFMIMDEKALRKTPAIGEVDGYVVERHTTRR